MQHLVTGNPRLFLADIEEELICRAQRILTDDLQLKNVPHSLKDNKRRLPVEAAHNI